MNSPEMIAAFKKLCEEMVEIMERKNHDYSKGQDPFKNLRRHGPYGVVVRMDDKLSRLDTFTNPKHVVNNVLVTNESFEDTCIDLANYAILCALMYRDGIR